MLESSTALCNYSITEIGILGREWRGDKDYIRLELNTSFFFIGNIKYNIHSCFPFKIPHILKLENEMEN